MALKSVGVHSVPRDFRSLGDISPASGRFQEFSNNYQGQ